MNHIGDTAHTMLTRLGEIVWAVNPVHDNLESLAAYIGKYAQNFMSHCGIRCRIEIPLHLPAIQLAAHQRHNLFMASKECLSNVLKHSGADTVTFSVRVSESAIVICIVDNGAGFDVDLVQKGLGNGIVNMNERMTSIGGRCVLSATPGSGCRVCYILPFEAVLNK
jgi:signal transduction histidine kinase